MSQEQNAAKRNELIEEKIEKSMRGINIQEVLKLYSSGVHKEHIKISFSLTDEQLLYILRKNVTADMVKRRKESLDRLKDFKIDVTIKKEEIPQVTIQEAINLVEGRGERE